MRALTVRAVLFAGLGDFFPLYAIYALMFADHGLNAGQISSLFALWSATAFLLEVPSGAWADTVSRRGLLVLSGVLLTLGFTLWTVLPSYLGFAAGFVVWGVSGALRSGTFEALLYDELSLRGEPSAFPRILGYTRAGTEIAVLIAILAATPLYLIGGYPLIGWVSVAMAAAHTVVALSLPGAPKAVSAAEVEEIEGDPTGAPKASTADVAAETITAAPPSAAGSDPSGVPKPSVMPGASGASSASTPSDSSVAPDPSVTPGPSVASSRSVAPDPIAASSRPVAADPARAPSPSAAPDSPVAPDSSAAVSSSVTPGPSAGPITRYLSMLRSGLAEATRVRTVRNGVVLGALLYGITAFDEYFALVAGEAGVATAVVPVLVAITVVGSLIGSVTAGRTETMRARTMGMAVAVAGVLFIAGAVVVGLATRWPAAMYVLAGSGFVALGVSYGVIYNAGVVAAARLQDAIEGPARATVTSVSGLLSEVVSLAAFGFVALVTVWLSMSATVALLGIGVLAIAAVTPAWLPRRPAPSTTSTSSGR
ncbi:MFS transporter [Nocardia cyriacigeorgica]|uniref:MFS transporter n=1 Tax=Nocardia cyriacigeorgica TaxID=135487 RepID=A0A5R8PMN3_9NOCA|nr:MFS transporter [Nocardia cyriacigeorgica]TLG17901.1 MFS transporter [Nocardia cyriacigeorgica]